MLLLAFPAWWVIMSFVQAIILHRLGLSWELSFTDSLVSNGLLAGGSLSAMMIYRFYQPGVNNKGYRFFYAIGITALVTFVLRVSLSGIFSQDPAYIDFLGKSMPVRFVVCFLVISFVTLLYWLWSNLQERSLQQAMQTEAEKLSRDAELLKLRQQLQPHFLFNSLNSISALVASKPAEARKMIQQLSDFLRGTLKKDEQQPVRLKEELDHLNLYLEIEKVRFGHRLELERKFTDDAMEAFIPPLLLQPIMENAIKFGLYGTLDVVSISITAKTADKLLEISISNPFDEGAGNSSTGTGFGLSSVQRRLYLLFGRNDLLITEKKETSFTTILKIPQ